MCLQISCMLCVQSPYILMTMGITGNHSNIQRARYISSYAIGWWGTIASECFLACHKMCKYFLVEHKSGVEKCGTAIILDFVISPPETSLVYQLQILVGVACHKTYHFGALLWMCYFAILTQAVTLLCSSHTNDTNHSPALLLAFCLNLT